jgi:geranylgeranyl diphosphate synthase, type II
MVEIKQYLNEQRVLIEEALQRYMLKAEGPFIRHIESMRYSLFVGGKRLRPILCLAAGGTIDDSSSTRQNLLPIACALECIHTYSLIHDDLPAMDDDDLRRGKPTNHKLFGEAGAILAGDGLLTWAFDLLTGQSTDLAPDRRLIITHIIARASGSLGMVGGQSLDISSENQHLPFSVLQTIHKSKTGALITCAVQAGAIGAGAGHQEIENLVLYGNQIGLAFQIVDDLLDVTATTEQLGKTVGGDAKKGKVTYPSLFGVESSKKQALEAITAAKDALAGFGEKAEPLRALADYIFSRSRWSTAG